MGAEAVAVEEVAWYHQRLKFQVEAEEEADLKEEDDDRDEKLSVEILSQIDHEIQAASEAVQPVQCKAAPRQLRQAQADKQAEQQQEQEDEDLRRALRQHLLPKKSKESACSSSERTIKRPKVEHAD